MQTITTKPTPMSIPRTNTGSYPWLMLISRSVLFMLFQGLIALIVALAGHTSAWEAWDESARWWTFTVSLANFASLYLLVRLYNAEGKSYFEVFHFSRSTWKTDLLWFIGFSVIAMPIVAYPREPLAEVIFGDPMVSTNMLFRPLPTWAFVLSFLFPLTIAFAELPTYFGYAMPRLEAQPRNGWVAWLIASFFLAAQHMFLPLFLTADICYGVLGCSCPSRFSLDLPSNSARRFCPTLCSSTR